MKLCERCGQEPTAVEIDGWDVCALCEPKERAKLAPKPVLPTGPVELMQPADLFRCSHYSCALMARACVERQGVPEEPQELSRAWKATGKAVIPFEYCKSGKCEQGALVKLRLGPLAEPQKRSEFGRIAANLAARRRGGPKPARAVVQPSALPPIPAPAAPTPAAPPPQKEHPMPRKSALDEITDDRFKEAHEELEGSPAALARLFGCSANAIRHRAAKLKVGAEKKPAPAKPKPAAAPLKLAPPVPAKEEDKPQRAPYSHGPEPEVLDQVQLPPPEQLNAEYILRVVKYAAKMQGELAAALGTGPTANRAVA